MPNVVRIPVAAGAFDPADITLTDDTSGALLIKEGSNEYMRINTTNGSELTTIKAGSTQGISINGNSRINVLTGTTDSNSDFRIINSGGVQIFRVQGNHDTRFRAQNFYITDKATDTPYLQTDTNTNFTYTLDDGSGATFTITDDNATPKLHLRCTQSASGAPQVEVNGLSVFPGKQLTLNSVTYGTNFVGSINQARWSISLGATSATRNFNIGAVSMDNFAQILTATPSTTGQIFTLDFNNTNTGLTALPIGLYKLVLKNAGTQSCTFTAASTMASGGRVKGVDVSGASIGVIDSSSGSITAAAGETIYVEVTNHVSDSAGGAANRFIICKTICKI